MNNKPEHHPSMNASLVNKMLRYRWWIFLILGVAYLLVYFHRLSLSVVADDLIAEFATSAGVMGLLSSIYFYCYAVMQLPAGLLSDSIGPRRTVSAFLLVAAAGSILFGMAPTIEVAFFSRVLVGFGVSMVFIPTMKILAQWFRKDEFASMAGLFNAVGGMGVLAGTWLLGYMAQSMGWRISFVLIGAGTMVIVVLAWLVVRDRPQDKGWPSIADIENKQATPPPAAIPLLTGLGRVLSEKSFWPVAIWFFFDCGLFFGFGGLWAGPYLMHVYGLSRAQAGGVLSMIAWGMIIGSPLMGFFSDRVVKSRKKPFILCGAVLCVEMLFLYLNPDGLSLAALYGVFFVFSICASAIVIVGFTTTKELFPVSMAGTSVGAVNLFPFLGGAIYMPLLGRVLDSVPQPTPGAYVLEGYTLMLLVLLVSAVAALGCTFFMKETFTKQALG